MGNVMDNPRRGQLEAQQSALVVEIDRLLQRDPPRNDAMRRMALLRGELLLHELRLLTLGSITNGSDDSSSSSSNSGEKLREQQLALEQRLEQWATSSGQSVQPILMSTKALMAVLPEFDGEHEYEWFDFRHMFETAVPDTEHRAYWLRKALQGSTALDIVLGLDDYDEMVQRLERHYRSRELIFPKIIREAQLLEPMRLNMLHSAIYPAFVQCYLKLRSWYSWLSKARIVDIADLMKSLDPILSTKIHVMFRERCVDQEGVIILEKAVKVLREFDQLEPVQRKQRIDRYLTPTPQSTPIAQPPSTVDHSHPVSKLPKLVKSRSSLPRAISSDLS